MKPYVARSEPVRVDRGNLHQIAVKHAETTFHARGWVVPTWLLATADAVYWIEATWDDPVEQDRVIKAVRRTIVDIRARCYAFICHGTVASLSRVPTDAAADLALLIGVHAVFPEAPKDDLLLVASHDPRETALTRFLVSDRRPGRSLLGPPITSDADEIEDFAYGMLPNFLAKGGTR